MRQAFGMISGDMIHKISYMTASFSIRGILRLLHETLERMEYWYFCLGLFINYAFEMASNGVTRIQSFINVGSCFQKLLDCIRIQIHRHTHTAAARWCHRHIFFIEKENQKTNIHGVEPRTITRCKCYFPGYRCSVTCNATYSVTIPKQYLLKYSIFRKQNDDFLIIWHLANFHWIFK
jgi:hypothetical protein